MRGENMKNSRIVRQRKKQMIIDLSGPLGDEVFLLTIAMQLSRHLGKDLNIFIGDWMKGGDYARLLDVFRTEFGDSVYLVE
jgi:hypothetical protein